MSDNYAAEIQRNLIHYAEKNLQIGVHYPGGDYIDFLTGYLEVVYYDIEHLTICSGHIEEQEVKACFIIRPIHKKLPTLRFYASNVGSFRITRKMTEFCMGYEYVQIDYD